MALLRIENLGQSYDGSDILTDVNLSLEHGEVFALIGPTGSGKTTLLKLLDLLETPSSGSIYFDDVDVTKVESNRLAARRRMALVQQKPVVFSMNVYDNVAVGLKWRGIDKASIKQKVEHALELVDMTDYAHRDAKTLSGGETQRVALARALALEPNLLLLDEPTANLDPNSVSKIEEIIEHVISEHKISIFMTTHNMLQGQRLADRVGVLIDGRMQQVGTPEQIFSAPTSKAVAEFVGIDNILAGTIDKKDGDLVDVKVTSGLVSAISHYELGQNVYALIRPEDITLSLAGEHGSARNAFSGKIFKITTLGSLVHIEVDCGFPLFVVLTARSALDMGLAVGTQVFVSFKATAIKVIKRWA
ncbi:MAG: ABC transporter ATP-binding protein [Chloroflexi bacterium]|mgnify:CR=1 FL=1|jgi:tungstate transport system ATP-binding protein|nr:ABC transporter ATP-binding protein [Chloroflexota bacterium]MBT7080901.1 ABC transporter ATP-binding protein [Chloroflexota bacterium]MBT7290344.1 ABC transporter ATP-binding protein [Chloroflexota bacterium]